MLRDVPPSFRADPTKEKIIEFLCRYVRADHLKEDEDIFELGIVNSLMAVQLVAFVEKEFEITIDNEDLDLDNFKNINAISSLISRKKEIPARSS